MLHQPSVAPAAPTVIKTSARVLRGTIIEPGTDDQAVTLQKEDNPQLYRDCALLQRNMEATLVPDKPGEKITMEFGRVPGYETADLHGHLNRIFGAGMEQIEITRDKIVILFSAWPDSLEPVIDQHIAHIETLEAGGRETTVMQPSSRGTDVILPSKKPVTVAENEKSSGRQKAKDPQQGKGTQELAGDALKALLNRRRY